MNGPISADAKPLRVVMLHGVGGDASMFEGVVAALQATLDAKAGLIALNLPGYGDEPPIEPYSFDGLAAWLDARLGLSHRDLSAQASQRIVLVGHSFGGMIALDAAARWPQALAGLVLMNSSAAFGRTDGTFQQDFIRQRVAPLDAGKTMQDVADKLVGMMLGEGAIAGASDAARRVMGRVPPATYRLAVACITTFDRRAALAQLAMPVLLLAGDQDKVAPASVMAGMAARMTASPHAHLQTLTAAGHLLPVEQPERVAAALTHFFQELVG